MTSRPDLAWYSLPEAAAWLSEKAAANWSPAHVLELAAQQSLPIYVAVPEGTNFQDELGAAVPIYSDRMFQLHPGTLHMIQLHGQAELTRVRLPVDSGDDLNLLVCSPRPVVTLDELRINGSQLRNELPVDHVAPYSSVCRNRSNDLTALIKDAQKRAIDPDDNKAVFHALVSVARSLNPPYPLLGYVESEGIQFVDDKGEVNYLTAKILGQRLRRAREKKRRPN